MKEYKYKNATIRITIPTEEQVRNIRKATERFLNKVAKDLKEENLCRKQKIK